MTDNFEAAINGFVRKTEQVTDRVLLDAAMTVHRSITVGDPLTGAPGQPVDTSNLKDSWGPVPVKSAPGVYDILSDVIYAPVIEYNIRGATLRSAVGGFHSRALTIAAWQNIVDDAVRKASA
jgi:hypothetical protein